jgi:hypothetical protein
MKRMIKNMIRSLWRISAPVHRPIIRKFDQHMMHLLQPFARAPEPVRVHSEPPPVDLVLVLNSLVRELARLQVQVDHLQQQINDLPSSDRGAARPESRLSVVAEIG